MYGRDTGAGWGAADLVPVEELLAESAGECSFGIESLYSECSSKSPSNNFVT